MFFPILSYCGVVRSSTKLYWIRVEPFLRGSFLSVCMFMPRLCWDCILRFGDLVEFREATFFELLRLPAALWLSLLCADLERYFEFEHSLLWGRSFMALSCATLFLELSSTDLRLSDGLCPLADDPLGWCPPSTATFVSRLLAALEPLDLPDVLFFYIESFLPGGECGRAPYTALGLWLFDWDRLLFWRTGEYFCSSVERLRVCLASSSTALCCFFSAWFRTSSGSDCLVSALPYSSNLSRCFEDDSWITDRYL